MILINNPGKSVLIISKMSRRDTIIVNCQLSIVNSAKPLNDHFSDVSWLQRNEYKASSVSGMLEK